MEDEGSQKVIYKEKESNDRRHSKHTEKEQNKRTIADKEEQEEKKEDLPT